MLQQLRQRTKSAARGYSLLKKKAEALTLHYRQIKREIEAERLLLTQHAQEAMFSLEEARFRTGGQLRNSVLQSVGRASMMVAEYEKSVVGVSLTSFDVLYRGDHDGGDGSGEGHADQDPGRRGGSGGGDDSKSLVGFAGDGRAVGNCRNMFRKWVETCVKVASLEVRRGHVSQNVSGMTSE